jgi:predicted O-linked N-acetylglucosamine transferase (SPINDLY family)
MDQHFNSSTLNTMAARVATQPLISPRINISFTCFFRGRNFAPRLAGNPAWTTQKDYFINRPGISADMPPSLMPSAKPLNVPQALAQAVALHQQGRMAEAERLYAAILAERPNHFEALHMLGVIKLAQGQLGEALQHMAAALRAKAPSPQILLNYGLVLNGLNRHQEALESFEHAIKLKSKFAAAHNNRGAVLITLGRNEEALESLRKALALTPNNAETLSNRGNAYMQLKRYDEALASYDRAIAARPDYAEAHYNRANTLKALNRFEEALASYDRAIAVRPGFAEAICNRGVALHELGRFDEAMAAYDRALALRPDYVEAFYNYGNALEHLKRYDEAVACFDRALALRPNLAEALSNRGNALRELKQFDQALQSYDRALALRPDFPEPLSNRGMILHEMGRYEEAVTSYDRAIAARPDYLDALSNRGATLQELKRFDQALADFERILAIKPDHAHAFSGAAFCSLNLCEWDSRPRIVAELGAHVTGKKSIVSTFVLLGYSDDPALQLQCAQNYLASKIPVLPPRLWTGQSWRHDKIRVAYLSADFRTHATAFLMAELFEKHDRSRFEFIAISFGRDEASDMRRRLIAAFDQFHDVRTKSDRDVAQLLRDLEVDIAIDLKGYTQEARPEILSPRPAPIQVSYLGYPGTMGAPFIDYFIADKVVAPFDLQPYFAEKIVHLPDSYQVNDSHRKIAPMAPTRQEAGLPAQGFVFCSFNNNWKIAPDVFDVWMRLLHQVEGSVLWLLSDNDGAERNLRKEAQRRGIDPARLVLAGRLLPEQHLARHALADLFLDTLPCNAHTTASDALWAGLPLITCEGRAFAGRVAASLLHGAGMPELVTTNLADYEALALKLARDPTLLAGIKAKLAQNRATCPLFDTTRFARHIEAAYTTMWESWQRGEAPKSFSVAPIG